MADEIKKGDKPTAQVFRLFKASRSDHILKDLGPNGVNNPGGAIQANAFEPEDEYQQLYVGATRDQGVIQPPYTPRTLDRLAQENNALSPCIEAMVTNIDGTGYEFVSSDDEAEDDEDDNQIDALDDFFNQPWPGVSFTTIRKLVRRDMERTGNGYLEIIRNAQDDIVFVRHIDAKMMRMLRLDDAVPVTEKITRMGKEQSVTLMKRERRYCQLVNGVTLMYFKEFGSSRDLHKKTAVWAPAGQKLPAPQRATEIMHFTVLPDSHTPYGVPRWISQLPSVLGSRKAEEFNLEFFDNGGVPPVMILLQGGTLQAETRRALETMSSGEAKKNNRMQVLEVEPSGGSLDSTPQAKVTVERFGHDRTSDSMFEKYDERCEIRVRRGFRLPPIFVGQAADYTFATAFASYTVAEAQVFKPERDEFDELITMRLLKAMGYEDYKLRSKPLVIEDATLKLQGIEIALGMQSIEPADLVEAINEAAGTKLQVSKDAKTLDDILNPPTPPTLVPGTATHTMDQQGKITPIPPINPEPTVGAGPGANGAAPRGVKPPMKTLQQAGGGQQTQSGAAQGTKTAPKSSGKGAKAALKKGDMPGTGMELAFDMLTALRKRDFQAVTKSLHAFNMLDSSAQDRVMSATRDLAFIDPTLDPEGLAALSEATVSAMHHSH